MKVSCLQANLNRGLNIVGRAVATRTTLPITNNVLLSTDQSRLKLVATNLEIAISCWLGAMVEEEGSTTVPAKLLTELVNSLPAEKVEIDFSGSTTMLKCARYQAKMSSMNAEDFPPVPQVKDGHQVKIAPQDLRQALNQVVFAAATEDTRPVLTGVSAELDGDTLTLAAADGFRLAVHKTQLASPSPEKVTAIIPGKTLGELNRLLPEQEEPVEIYIGGNKNQLLFSLKEIEMVSQLLQGTFPNYKQLIPQNYTTRVVLSTSEFLKATKTVSIFARDGSGIVRLQISKGSDATPGKVTLIGRSEQLGENVGEIDGIVEGQDAKIAFNSKYLADVLGIIGESQIALEMTGPSSPGVLKPVGSDKYIHVIMPMFVQW